jgi:hypothetical protein
MADRRKSPRLVMLDNGKEEATEDDGKEEATGVASRKGCCLAACSVVDLTSLASDLDPNAPEYLDPNATPCLRGNCSNAASKTVAERTVDAVMVGDGALSEDDDCALPTVDGLTSRLIVGWPDGGLDKVNGAKAGWGFTLCEQKNINGELVMELVDDGCGPVIEQHHPEWMQPCFWGSTDQSPGQAEFCGTIEMLKRMHGVAL